MSQESSSEEIDEAINDIAAADLAALEDEFESGIKLESLPDDVDEAIAQLEQGAAMDDGMEITDDEIELGGNFSLSDEDLNALVADTPLEEGDPFEDSDDVESDPV